MTLFFGFNPSRSRATRYGALGVLMLGAALVLGGCGSKAPDPAQTQAMSQTETNSRLQAIQNDPHLSPQARQNAINTIKAQQAFTSRGQTGSSPR